LCEGAQGFELDIDWGDYPYVTSSHCNVGSVVLNGIPPQKIRNIFGVAKIYDTYVGTKKFEPDQVIFKQIRLAGNEYGATTGRPRQCNWLNLDGMIKAIQQNGATQLIINKCDILNSVGVYNLIYKDKIVSFDSFEYMQAYIKHICMFRCKETLKRIYFSSNPKTIEGFQYE